MRDSLEIQPLYCHENLAVQAFVAERIRDFNPYSTPETMRDVFQAARAEFGDLACFYLS